MGRTVPSFRIVIAEEKQEWKPFKKALDKSERKIFDEMWDIPRLYVSACSNSVQIVPFHPIVISILFHHYKELFECNKEIEEMEAANDSKTNFLENNKFSSTIRDEEEEELKEEIPTTLNGYFLL